MILEQKFFRLTSLVSIDVHNVLFLQKPKNAAPKPKSKALRKVATIMRSTRLMAGARGSAAPPRLSIKPPDSSIHAIPDKSRLEERRRKRAEKESPVFVHFKATCYTS